MIKNDDETKKVPVILLSVLDKKIDNFWGKKAGAQLFLSKSIDLKELISSINATIRRYPVTDEYKSNLTAKAASNNSAQFKLNNILNDLLMKSVFSNEFRNLSDFLNYERILVEKLFSLFSSFVEYNVAGVYFASPDDFAENIIYIDTLGRNLSKNLLSDISYDFFRTMEEHKSVKEFKFEVVRMLLGKELDYQFTDLTSKIVIPLIFDKKLIGGICFYTRHDVDYSSFRYFDIMISELLAIFKMKYQYTEKEFMSVLDGLTGLYNRRQFELRLGQEIATTKRQNNPLCAMMIDVDFFKKVNDTYGHNAGDEVLKAVASQLKKAMIGNGFAARWGGEEFVLIFDRSNVEDSVKILEGLADNIRAMIVYTEGYEIKITMTMGVSAGTSGDVEAIVESADAKLYYGKEHGRNQIVAEIPEEDKE